jgi:hypothetical protein
MKKHLNLTILIAIGVLAVLVVGYCYYQLQVEQKAFNWQKFAFVHKSTTVDTSDWLTYRNEQYGFEFKYPKEWKLEIKKNNNQITTLEINFLENNKKSVNLKFILLPSDKVRGSDLSIVSVTEKDLFIDGKKSTYYTSVDFENKKSYYINIELGKKTIIISGSKEYIDNLISTLKFIN